MRAADTPADSDPIAALREAALLRHSRALAELTEIGMTVARALGDEAKAAAEAAEAGQAVRPLSEMGLAYSRVSRAVRLTVMLEAELLNPSPAGGKDDEDKTGEPERLHSYWGHNTEYQEVQAKVKAAIRDLAEGEGRGPEAVEALVREAAEKLEAENFFRVLLKRPIRDTVEEICADLGVTLDLSWIKDEAFQWARRIREEKAAAIARKNGLPPPDPEPEQPLALICAERAWFGNSS